MPKLYQPGFDTHEDVHVFHGEDGAIHVRPEGDMDDVLAAEDLKTYDAGAEGKPVSKKGNPLGRIGLGSLSELGDKWLDFEYLQRGPKPPVETMDKEFRADQSHHSPKKDKK